MSEYKTQDYEQIPYQVAELNKQIILLKQENEKLKEQVRFKNQFRDYAHKYKAILDEIEEYIYTDCEYNDGCDRNICIRCKYSNVHDKRILQLIKQAKEDE